MQQNSAVALQEETPYQRVFERNLAAIFRCTLDGHLLECNDAFARVYGCDSREEALSHGCADFYFDPNDRLAYLAQLQQHGIVRNVELRGRRKDGKPVWVLSNAALLPSADGLSDVIEGTDLDITDLKRSQEALHASELKFRTLAETAPAAIGLFDGCRLSYVNAAMENITGYPRRELLTMDPRQIVHPDFRGQMQERAAARLRGETISPRYETCIVRKDGEIRWIDLSAALVQFEGTPSVLGIGYDITERKRAEDSRRQSYEMLQGVAEGTTDAVFVKDMGGRYLLINRAGAAALGRSAEEVIGKTDLELQPADLAERLISSDASAISSGRAQTTEELVANGDDVKSFLATKAPYHDSEGRVRGVIGISRDITDRKKAETERQHLLHEIQRSATEWRTTFDALEVSLLLLDEQRRIRRINRSAQQLSGRTFPELQNLDFGELAHAQPWQAASELVGRVATERKILYGDVQDAVSGDSWQIEALPVSEKGSGDRTVLILRNTTALVKLRETLLRTERLSTLGSLVAGVVHEVRNPLFGISSTLDAFEARFGVQPEYERYIRALRRETTRMADLMKQLQDLGKPSAAAPSPLEMREVLQHALHACTPQATQVGVELRASSEPSAVVLADRLQLIQVFQILLENAIQHSAAGQAVELEIRRVERSGRSWVECRVKDSGTGIEEADLDRIFEPFFSRRQGGNGLGLAIAQRIVEDHRGTISLSNRTTRGVEATVALPADRG